MENGEKERSKSMRAMFAKGYRLVLEEYGSMRERIGTTKELVGYRHNEDKKRRPDMFFWENIVDSKMIILEKYWINSKHIWSNDFVLIGFCVMKYYYYYI